MRAQIEVFALLESFFLVWVLRRFFFLNSNLNQEREKEISKSKEFSND